MILAISGSLQAQLDQQRRPPCRRTRRRHGTASSSTSTTRRGAAALRPRPGGRAARAGRCASARACEAAAGAAARRSRVRLRDPGRVQERARLDGRQRLPLPQARRRARASPRPAAARMSATRSTSCSRRSAPTSCTTPCRSAARDRDARGEIADPDILDQLERSSPSSPIAPPALAQTRSAALRRAAHNCIAHPLPTKGVIHGHRHPPVHRHLRARPRPLVVPVRRRRTSSRPSARRSATSRDGWPPTAARSRSRRARPGRVDLDHRPAGVPRARRPRRRLLRRGRASRASPSARPVSSSATTARRPSPASSRSAASRTP